MATITGYTKAGTDAKAAPLATTAPLAPGVATAGTSGAAARADHVHPLQPSPEAQAGAFGADMYLCPIGPPSADGNSSAYKAQGTPLPIYRSLSVKALAVRAGANDATTPGTVEVACYAANANGLPTGGPVFVTPAVAASSGTKVFTLATAKILTPGLYFMFCGARGFGTERSVLDSPRGGAGAAAAFVPHSTYDPFYPLAISLKNFNPAAAAGVWPTLAGTAADLEFNKNASSIWGYGIQSDPVV